MLNRRQIGVETANSVQVEWRKGDRGWSNQRVVYIGTQTITGTVNQALKQVES